MRLCGRVFISYEYVYLNQCCTEIELEKIKIKQSWQNK